MRICGFEARIVSCHTPLPVRRERNFPKKEEPVVLELSTAENGRDKSDSTEEVPVQKVKTAIRGLRNKAYGVLSHVPSRRAIVKDRLRLWKEGVRDLVMELCCALHNFRVRLTPWQPMI